MQFSDSSTAEWMHRQSLAEGMIPLIGRLYREQNVVTSVHGRSLVGRSATGILKAHRFARRIDGTELSVDDTSRLLERIATLPIEAAEIDLALLAAGAAPEIGRAEVADSLQEALFVALTTGERADPEQQDVVLYGFGRIGRLIARILIGRNRRVGGLRLRAIVVRRGAANDLVKRASLLRRDSVHGAFEGSITVDEAGSAIIANGVRIQVIYADDPADIDYEAYGIRDAIVVDNTGVWRDADGLSAHLRSRGAGRVVLTAPGKGDLKNIVVGVNDGDLAVSDRIVTAASCTTNAIAPVLAVMDDRFGIVHGHAETVHSYTNDQNLIDNLHKGDRRGRSAPMNMVITETGAGQAISSILPRLRGRLTASSIRVPTPDVSLAILHLSLDRATSREELNDTLRSVSLTSHLREQIDFTDSPEIVSTDIVGSTHAGVVDGGATIGDGPNVVLYVWYDNEFGYSSQVVRMLEKMAGVERVVFPRSAFLALTSTAHRSDSLSR